MVGVGLWLVDIFVRIFTIYKNNRSNNYIVKLIRLPSNVIRLTFPKKNFKYRAGQYAFINIP